MIEVLYVLMAAAVACSILGVFLVLRGLAMISDAISHSILLGIVLAYFLTKDLTSIYLILGASLFGILTCICIAMLAKTGLISEDASVGIVFPLFFSFAVILISMFAQNVHLDTDMVLMGEVIMAPFSRIEIFGLEMPKALWIMLLVFAANLSYILIFYRRLKISSFDPGYARIAGIATGMVYYSLMGMVSLTSVAAFESVGAILTIAFFIAPAASAVLITKDLKYTLLLAMIYAIINSYIGYTLALHYNVSISGMCASVSGLTFLITVCFYPQGIVTRQLERRKKRHRFGKEMLILHMDNHRKTERMHAELGISSMRHHVKWTRLRMSWYMRELIYEGLVLKDEKNGIYILTEKGIARKEQIRKEYGLSVTGKTD